MGQFDVTPIDPMGAVQDWKQTLAKTAYVEGQVEQQKQTLQQANVKAQQEAKQKQADDRLLSDLKQIPQNIPEYERQGERSRILMEAGRFREAETVIQHMGQNMQREARAEELGAVAELKKVETQKKQVEGALQIYSGVRDSMTLKLAEDMYKQTYGHDSPLKKYTDGVTDPKKIQSIVDFARNALAKKQTDSQVEMDQARTERLRAAAKKDGEAKERTQMLIQGRAEQAEAREAAKVKTMGPAAKLNPDERRILEDTASQLWPEITAANKLNGLREVGMEAKDYQLAKGGSFQDAVKKVIANDPNRFVVQEAEHPFFGANKPGKVTISQPLEIPKTPQGKVDPTQLRIGKPYKIYPPGHEKGVTAYWNGQGFDDQPPKGAK